VSIHSASSTGKACLSPRKWRPTRDAGGAPPAERTLASVGMWLGQWECVSTLPRECRFPGERPPRRPTAQLGIFADVRGESGGERATACMCGRNGVLGVEPGTRRGLEGVLAAANAEGSEGEGARGCGGGVTRPLCADFWRKKSSIPTRRSTTQHWKARVRPAHNRSPNRN